MTPRQRIRSKSPKWDNQARQIAETYADAKGRTLADVRLRLGERPIDWERPIRIRDPRVCQTFHRLHPVCWISGDLAQAHHGASGYLRGKADHLCAMFALSAVWHARVNTTELPLAQLLWLKWTFDWEHTDWEFLQLLFGYHLPDLEPFA